MATEVLPVQLEMATAVLPAQLEMTTEVTLYSRSQWPSLDDIVDTKPDILEFPLLQDDLPTLSHAVVLPNNNSTYHQKGTYQDKLKCLEQRISICDWIEDIQGMSRMRCASGTKKTLRKVTCNITAHIGK